MNKFLLLSLLFTLTSCDFIREVTGVNEYQSKAKQTMGKLILTSAYTAMKMGQVDTRKYSVASFLKFKEQNNSKDNIYSIYMKHEACPDCGMDDEKFKIVALGNVDKDETLDVWTMDEKNNLVHLVNDLEN